MVLPGRQNPPHKQFFPVASPLIKKKPSQFVARERVYIGNTEIEVDSFMLKWPEPLLFQHVVTCLPYKRMRSKDDNLLLFWCKLVSPPPFFWVSPPLNTPKQSSNYKPPRGSHQMSFHCWVLYSVKIGFYDNCRNSRALIG